MQLSGYRSGPWARQPNGIVAFLGDSRTEGTSKTYPFQTMALPSVVAKGYRARNFGRSGWTMLQVSNALTADLTSIYTPGIPNIAVIWAGVNDFHASISAQTVYDRTATACTSARNLGWYTIVCSEIDNQSTPGNNVSYHTTLWQPFLTLLYAGWSTFADRLADLGATLTNALDTNLYKTDALHLNDLGQGTAAGIVAAEVNAL